jgi:hypothetical protein
MSFTPKQWKDKPDTTTPVNADSVIDLETRLSAYTDVQIAGGLRPQHLGVYFGGDDAMGTKLFLAVGNLDRMTPVGAPVFTPTIGSAWCRDPDVEFWQGKYWLAFTHATFGQNVTGFGLAYSTDLQNWTQMADVDMSAAVGGAANRVWVDQWFIHPDTGQLHLFLSCTSGGDAGNFTRYETHPTNSTATTWSAPVLCSSGLPTTTLDYSPIKDSSGTWHLFYKNNATERIGRATATSFLGPWSVQTADIFGNSWPSIEASFVIRRPGGGYRLFFDRYVHPSFPGNFIHARTFYSDSSDLITWGTPQQHPNLGRHARVHEINGLDAAKLLASASSSFCELRRFAAQTLANNTIVPIQFDQLPEDTDGMWSGTAGSGSPLDAALSGNATPVANVRNGSVYTVTAHGIWLAGTGDRYMEIDINGIPIITQKLTNGNVSIDSAFNVAQPLRLYRGDQVRLAMYQSSGGLLDTGTPPGVTLRLVRTGN